MAAQSRIDSLLEIKRAQTTRRSPAAHERIREALPQGPDHEVTVDDIRQLMGASTPHFALQIRNRIARLIRGLPEDHPAQVEGEREIARLSGARSASSRRRGRRETRKACGTLASVTDDAVIGGPGALACPSRKPAARWTTEQSPIPRE